MPDPIRVLYIDPYHTASHRSLAESLKACSAHEVRLLTLPARKWKWRMRGAALAVEGEVRKMRDFLPQIVVTTDFLNLPEFLALTRDLWPRPVPAVIYFHENQLTYPASSADIRDFHFGLVNLYSALAADKVLFNSRFHLDEFLSGCDELIKMMPDFRPVGIGERIRVKAEVLGLPLDLVAMERARSEVKEPWILWNHRWEEDRNPGAFFEAMLELDAMAGRGEAPEFRLVVAGQTYQNRPAVFDEARRKLAHRIEHWGFIESRWEYLKLAGRCAVAVSTSRHEFFGVSVLEAIFMGCAPVLPDRLTYPAMVLGNSEFLYKDDREIPKMIAAALARPRSAHLDLIRGAIRGYGRDRIIGRWDEIIDETRR